MRKPSWPICNRCNKETDGPVQQINSLAPRTDAESDGAMNINIGLILLEAVTLAVIIFGAFAVG
jgi:hypothetical protein